MNLVDGNTLKLLLKKHSLWAKKGLGQNFLVDEKALEQIIDASSLTTEDVVVEVGPGCGVLTQALAPHVKTVHAVELDAEIIPVLEEVMAKYSNVTIHNQDIRSFTPPDEYKVVANIPYYLTGKILRYFLEECDVKPSLLVLMTQWEVAEKLTAEPPNANLLSTAVHTLGTPEIIAKVPASSFHPKPKVDSAIIRIKTHTPPDIDLKAYFKVVRAGFSQPRKQIHNNLKAQFPDQNTEEWLSKCSIEHTRRPQTLTIEEWVCVTRAFESSSARGEHSRNEK